MEHERKKLQWRTFLRLYVSYALVMFLPFISLLEFTYSYSFATIEQQTQEMSEQNISSMQSTFDDLISSIKLLSVVVSSDNDIQRLISAQNAVDYARIGTNIQNVIANRIVHFTVTNRFIQDMALFTQNEQLALTSSGVYKIDDYLDLALNLEAPFESQLRKLLSMTDNFETTTLQLRGTRFGAELSTTAFVFSLPLYSTAHMGTLMITMDQERMERWLASRTDSMGQSAYLIDADKNVLAGDAQSLWAHAGLDGVDWTTDGAYWIDDGHSLLRLSSSRHHDWKYIYVTSIDSLLQQSTHVRSVLCIYLAVTLVLGLVMCALIAQRQYKPIHDMLKAVPKDMYATGATDKNALSYIQRYYGDLIRQREAIHRNTGRMREQLGNFCLSNMLLGNYQERDEMLVRDIERRLPNALYNTAVVCTAGERDLPPELVNRLTQAIQADMLRENITCIALPVSVRHLGLILNMPLQDERMSGDMTAVLAHYKPVWEGMAGAVLTIALGTQCAGLEQLSCSYRNAQLALTYRLIWGEDAVFEYQAPTGHRRMYLSAEAMQRLANFVKANDCTGVENEIMKLMSESIADLPHHSDAVAMMLYNLLNMAYCLKDELKTDFDDHMLGVAQSKDWHMATDAILGIYRKLAELSPDVADRNRSIMQERINRYINAHYTSSDMSLRALADHLDVSVNYLSRFFKSAMKVNYLDMVNDLRMNRATDLLEHTDMNIADVATQCGFDQDMSFRRAFKRRYGITPGQYRKSKSMDVDAPDDE